MTSAVAVAGRRCKSKSTLSDASTAALASAASAAASEQQQQRWIVNRQPVLPHDLSPPRTVPHHIPRPPYAATGHVEFSQAADEIVLHTAASAARMRAAARLAATVLHKACSLAKYPAGHPRCPATTTDDVDRAVHDMIVAAGAYPSPLNYAGFPKSVCSSINEVICHGIPDARPLQFGDVVSFDVSCFLNGVHGDNCATVIVGDYNDDDDDHYINGGNGEVVVVAAAEGADCDWRGVPYRTHFGTEQCHAHFLEARRLVQATREALLTAIATVGPGSCLTEIGAACQDVAESYGYSSVTKYRGHGVGEAFHTAPFVKHYRNDDVLTLRPGMIFTIEPMLCQYSASCFEWEHDNWTVATTDGGLAAQFEHTVLVTETGVEILTLPDLDGNDDKA